MFSYVFFNINVFILDRNNENSLFFSLLHHNNKTVRFIYSFIPKNSMKNRLKRGILAGSLAAALALGCGSDSSRAVGPKVDDSYYTTENSRVRNVEEARTRISQHQGYNTNRRQLEDRLNEVDGFFEKVNIPVHDYTKEELDNLPREEISEMQYVPVHDYTGRSGSEQPMPAGKSAQAILPIVHVPYGEFSGDIDLDHDVDFNDFFLLADGFGDIYTFEEFFKLADNFGREVNVVPIVNNLTLDKNNADIGEEVLFTGFAHDIDGDNLRYSWLVNGDEIEVNGGELRREFSNPGEYLVGLRVTDDLGAQSNELVRTLMVESRGPELSLPSDVSFDQYVSGDFTGNVFILNLDDYVFDTRFSDSQLTWTVDDNSVENNQFTFWPRLPFWFGYTEKALHLDKDGNELVINPVANFSGSRYVNFTVTNPDGKDASKRVRVNVVKTPEFDDWYNDVVTGGYQDFDFDEPPEISYIWDANGVSREGEWPLSEGRGPSPTQEEKDYFVTADEMKIEVSDYFRPTDVVSISNWNELMDSDKTAVCYYIDDYAVGGTTYPIINRSGKKIMFIGVNSISRPNNRFLSIAIHELYDHGVGMDHPENDRQALANTTIFSGGNRLDYIPNLDKTVIDSFYETKQY